MRKLHQANHGWFRPRDLLLPLVTLGFYGLRQFQPRWLYVLVALLVLGAWLALTVVASLTYDGGEYLIIPVVFVMTGITFLRLMPSSAPRATSNR